MIFTLLSPLVSVDVQNVGKPRDEKRDFVWRHAFLSLFFRDWSVVSQVEMNVHPLCCT